MRAVVVTVAVVLALGTASAAVVKASEPACRRGAEVAHLTEITALFDTPRGAVVARRGPESAFLRTATAQWHDGTWWWLLADARDVKPVGWVPAGDNVNVVDCGLDLLLEMDRGQILKKDDGVIIRGKIPLTKDR